MKSLQPPTDRVPRTKAEAVPGRCSGLGAAARNDGQPSAEAVARPPVWREPILHGESTS